MLWRLGAVARRALPKNLIHPLPVQDHKDDGFGDLLSRSLVHAHARDGETMAAAQHQEEAKTLAQLYRPIQHDLMSRL
jgi:hypothetical protein